MRTSFKLPVTLLSAATAACFTLAACTGDVDPESELVDDDAENISIEAPGMQTVPEANGAKSADTDQPRIGADSVDAELGSPVAQPGLDQPSDMDVRANQGAANE